MTNSNKIISRSTSSISTIRSTLKLMDNLSVKSLIILDNNKFNGLISIGDIQRAIINNKSLDTPIRDIQRKKIRFGNSNMTTDEIRQIILLHKMELFPIINNENEISDCYFWEDFFPHHKPKPYNKFNLPIVIMAGGLGTRLKPLTNVLPKPLIPIGEKTMLEEIFDRFAIYGCDNFHVSINYKAELIEYYISEQKLPYSISYFRENKPLGTAGSLHLLKDKINCTFFVTNCDILIEQDYSEILEFHHANQNEITIVAVLKNYSIPYGTIETAENGRLLCLNEKPEITYKINSGMYILEPNLINEIPTDQTFHITQLIDKIKDRNGKIGVFPVSEKSWKDVGSWEELIKHLK